MSGSTDPVRIEHDSLGPVEVPAGARYGAQTQRAVQNFRISGRRMPAPVIHAIARIKAAAAEVSGASDSVPGVDAEMGAAIAGAAAEVAGGRWDDEFPVDVYQTGSGTSTNMNVNEVIASLATERLGRPVHPNDHVNACQSSNDVVPSAIRISVAAGLRERLAVALDHLAGEIRAVAGRHATAVTAGRTHLMDAAPLFEGQALGAWATQVELASAAARRAVEDLLPLPLGGSAVGTGLNVPEGWAAEVIARVAGTTGLPLRPVEDRFAAMAGGEAYASAGSAVRVAAVALTKVADDLRLLASGPHTGLGELHLPDLQPGSSIMPGKVNPVVPESTAQVAARVLGNDVTLSIAASRGNLQLNTYLPLVAEVLHESIELVAAAATNLADRCIAGIEVDVERAAAYAAASPALVTGLAATIGYERAAEAVHRSESEGRALRDVLAESGIDPAALDELLDPVRLARGGR